MHKELLFPYSADIDQGDDEEPRPKPRPTGRLFVDIEYISAQWNMCTPIIAKESSNKNR